MQNCCFFFLFFPHSFPVNSRCQSNRVFFLSSHSLTHYTTIALSTCLCPIGPRHHSLFRISGKNPSSSHFLKIRVQSTKIYLNIEEYINLFTFLCHKYIVKYMMYSMPRFCSAPPSDPHIPPPLSICNSQHQWQMTIFFFFFTSSSISDVLHEQRPGTNLIGQGKLVRDFCFQFYF